MSAIVLDIEGTTTDKRFVTDVLFPYARSRVAGFLKHHADTEDVANIIDRMRMEMAQPDASIDMVAQEFTLWIDQDLKREPLKTLQGLIWRNGYESGELKSHLYPDVPAAFQRWTKTGKTIAIFSSGSVGAQKLLFANTVMGDLTPYICAYFDLSTGPKTEAKSYRRIAKSLETLPEQIHFYSDMPREVEAALNADLRSTLVERDGPVDASPQLKRISSFSDET